MDDWKFRVVVLVSVFALFMGALAIAVKRTPAAVAAYRALYSNEVPSK